MVSAGPAAAASTAEKATDLMPSSSATVAASPSSEGGAAGGGIAVDTTPARTEEQPEQPEASSSCSTAGHPYGVKPWGNFLTDGGGQEELRVRADGLGRWLRALPDEVLVHTWLPWLDGQDLARLSRCSRALYAFGHYPDLWKALVLTSLSEEHAGLPAAQRSPEGPRLRFRGSWKETYVRLVAAGAGRDGDGDAEYESPSLRHRPVRVRGLYSDVLHAPYAAAAFRGRGLKPAWLNRDNCPRLHRPTLEEFRRACEEPNMPCLLTGVMDDWPALRKWRTPELFAQAAAEALAEGQKGEMTLHGGGLSFTVPEYANYAREARHDDLPLYIFDSRFADKSPALAADYAPFLPAYFEKRADLFSLLELTPEEKEEGTEQRRQGRPDHRWIIWGPRGSGSTFHKDPNATSAWNAVLKGSKKWILLPPHVTPPGVHPSADGLDLTTPITLAEWFEAFYVEAAKGPGFRDAIVEAVCREGEVMFVPRGWWHLVLNLEESLAITQNFVSEVGLPHVLRFLDTKRHLISGLPDEERPQLHERFLAALRARAPDVLARAVDRGGAAAESEEGGETGAPAAKRCKAGQDGGLLASWEAVNDAAAKDRGGFSFGFVL